MHAKKLSAIAAVAVLFLLAAVPAKAGNVNFVIDPSLSFISYTETIDLSAIASGIHVTVPQFPDPDGAGPITGSDVTSISGMLKANLTPGFIELLPGNGYNLAINNTPGVGGVPGAYSPFDPLNSPPGLPPGGVNPNSNFGVSATTGISAGLAHFEVVHQGGGDWLTGFPGPRPLTGIVFDYFPGGDFLLYTYGRHAWTSLFDVGTESLVGFPNVALGTAGLAKPTWDPAAGVNGVLTLPIESSFSFQIDLGHIVPGAIGWTTLSSFGVIVAVPNVPEPSSIVLLGFGFVALAAWGWRRKR